ncbi:hypothetical protein DFH09DRAFT_1103058 [Mycena vulgaris]|nr:hypothetical protein DFH09DRAFT_1103058 [Mycena vulgaris]
MAGGAISLPFFGDALAPRDTSRFPPPPARLACTSPSLPRTYRPPDTHIPESRNKTLVRVRARRRCTSAGSWVCECGDLRRTETNLRARGLGPALATAGICIWYLDARRFENGWALMRSQDGTFETWISDMLVRNLEKSGLRFEPELRTTQPRAGVSLEFARAIRGPWTWIWGWGWRDSGLIRRARTSAEGRDTTVRGGVAAVAGSAQGWVDRGRAGDVDMTTDRGGDRRGREWTVEGEEREGGRRRGVCGKRRKRGEGEGEEGQGGEERRTRTDEEEGREEVKRRSVKGEHTKMIERRGRGRCERGEGTARGYKKGTCTGY